MAGRGRHRAPRVKDAYKREVGFTLVPSNLGKKGRTCSYSARLTHNQVLDEETVVSQMCEDGKSSSPSAEGGCVAQSAKARDTYYAW